MAKKRTIVHMKRTAKNLEDLADRMGWPSSKNVEDRRREGSEDLLRRLFSETAYPPMLPPGEYNSGLARSAGVNDIPAAAARSIMTPGMAEGGVAAPGLLEPGNIDLNRRPRVFNNDGSMSTVRSIGSNVEGKEVLLPTVRANPFRPYTGWIMKNRQAEDHYRKTGQHLGIFDTPENSDAYARRLHEEQERQYLPLHKADGGAVEDLPQLAPPPDAGVGMWPAIKSGVAAATDFLTPEYFRQPENKPLPPEGREGKIPTNQPQGWNAWPMAAMDFASNFTPAGAGKLAMAAAPKAALLLPALKYKNRIFKGPPGTTHGDLYETIPVKLQEKIWDNVGDLSKTELSDGFVTEGGKFLNRKQAYGYAKKYDLLENSRQKKRSVISEDLRSTLDNWAERDEYADGGAVSLTLTPIEYNPFAPNRASGGRVDASAINHNPTEAQKASGNYAKDHVRIHGLDITIENAKGKPRSGVGSDGRKWSARMPAHYGYIKRTEGADGDHTDVYLGPAIRSPKVFIVNQRDAETGAFDEHKCFLGFGSKGQVVATYRKGFSDGKADRRLGAIVEMSVPEFKAWLKNGDTTKEVKV